MTEPRRGTARLRGMAWSQSLLVVLLLAGLSACGGLGDPDSASDSSNSPDGSAAADAPAAGDYVARDLPEPFGPDDQVDLAVEDGQVRARGTCNSMFGGADWSDGTLSVETMAMTQMGCPGRGHEQDDFLVAFFEGSPAWAADGEGFTLTADETVLEFRPLSEVDPDRPLTGTTWLLESIATDTGPDGSVSSVPGGVKSSLLIRKNGEVQLRPGCNSGGTTVEITDDQLTFAPIRLTLMACPGPKGDVENVVVPALDGTVDYEISGPVLTITSGDVQLVYRATE